MGTVTVGCKLPLGIMMSAQVGEKVLETRINGYMQGIVEASHGLTYEVPEELWAAWLEKFKSSDIVRNGFIFASKNEKSVKAEAKEKEKNKTKLEQLPQITADAKEGALGKIDK